MFQMIKEKPVAMEENIILWWNELKAKYKVKVIVVRP